jgi:hypothetical protein
MNCFDGIVYLKGCGEPNPGSVYSLNTLPGISLKSFEQVANSEQINYIGVWNAINERAGARLNADIIAKLSERYKLMQVRRTVDTYTQPLEIVVAESKFKGLYVNSSYLFDSNYQLSPFQTINVDRLRFYVSNNTTATSATIQIFDWHTREVLWSYVFTFAGKPLGWNQINVNKAFNSVALGIGFDSTDIESAEYSSNKINNYWSDCCYTCFNCECGEIKGFSGNSINDISKENNITGIQAVLTLGCSYDAAVCNNRLLFALPYWYALGVEFMVERLYSERINFMTVIKREEAQELKEHYTVEYEKALTNIVKSLTFDCDVCIKCDSIVQSFSQLP